MNKKKVYEDVGMINPYALYEVRFKEKVKWKQLTHEQKKEKLGKLFPYNKLWDPKHRSPLYPWTKKKKGKQVPVLPKPGQRLTRLK